MTHVALAVELQLEGPQAPRVRDWVESVLGWQAVDGPDGGLVPSLALTDAVSESVSALPTLVIVDEADDPVRVAGRVLTTSAAGIVAWPGDRDLLPAAADRAIGLHAEPATSLPIRVGGTAGGVGATTVGLALGGLLAWSGVRTLVLAQRPVPVRGVASVSADATGAHGLWAHATAVPGVPRLRAIAVDGPPAEAPPDGTGGLVLVDAGVDPDVDVLVGRRDAATVAALEITCASVLVLADQGAVGAAAIEGALGARRIVTVPWSRRVAAAGVAGRVPSALPGTWLTALRPVAARLIGQLRT